MSGAIRLITRRRLLCAGAALVTVPGCVALRADAADAGPEGPLVLTGIQATYSIATALAVGTPIRVQNVPPDGRELALQKDYIERRMERLAPLFESATAVVTLTNALPGDPLYRFAREANIRIVDIEAAVPWSPATPGVALTDAPASTVDWGSDPDPVPAGVAPYFWLSISNAIRMADIMAADLAALFPGSAGAISANLDMLKRSLLRLRGEYQDRLIQGGSDVVFALTGDFVYLTNDMGLLVDGYFIKQDLNWTDADLASLTRHLQDHRIRVVLHRWMPSEAIQAAIRAGGARLAVLDAADPGIVVGDSLAADGLQQVLRRNLEAIGAALQTE